METKRIEIADYHKDFGYGRYTVRVDGETKGFDLVTDVLEHVLNVLIGKEGKDYIASDWLKKRMKRHGIYSRVVENGQGVFMRDGKKCKL